MAKLGLLADEVGASARTLRRAVSEGTIRATRPTPRGLEISLTERRYIRRRWTLLSSLKAALRTEPNVRFALLFGSAASGSDEPSSDVDVLVALRDPGLERLADLAEKLEAAIARTVDLVRIEDAESEPLFLAEALASGRVLVDRGQLWRQLRSREARLRRRAAGEEPSRVTAALAGIDQLLAA